MVSQSASDAETDRSVPVSDRWYFCLKHNTVEPEVGCANKDRMGPYATQDEAAHAMQTAARRNEEWEAQDEDD
jgi:hypothetical protein